MPQGPGFFVTFLYYFATNTLIVALLVSQQLHTGLISPLPLQLGVCVGCLGGLAGAYLNHTRTISLSFTSKKIFSAQIKQLLAEMGFEVREEKDDYTVYGKSGLASLFSGKLLVQIEKNSSTIVGRSRLVKKLQGKIGTS